MPKYKVCAVLGCTPGRWSPSKLYSFPKKIELRNKWIKLCSFKPLNLCNARVCGRHFSDKQKSRNLRHELLNYKPSRYRDLKEDAVPDLNLPNSRHPAHNEDYVANELHSLLPQPEMPHPLMKEDLPEMCEVALPSAVNPRVFQQHNQPRLTVDKTSAEPQTSAITWSLQQQPSLSSTVTQSSNIMSSVQQQPLLTVILPQTSAISSSVQQQPLFALVMPKSLNCPEILQDSSLTQIAMTRASTILSSSQQQSTLHFSNPQLLSYLTFIEQQPMVRIPTSPISVGQNSVLQKPFLLSSAHQSLPANTVAAVDPLLEHVKEPEFVQVKEEAKEFSPGGSHDNVIKEEPAFISPITSVTAIKEEALEVLSAKMDGDHTVLGPLFAPEGTSQQASEDLIKVNVPPRPTSNDTQGHLEVNADWNDMDFHYVEVKVEIKEEDGDGDLSLPTEHQLSSQESTDAAVDRMDEQPVDLQPLRDSPEKAAPSVEPVGTFTPDQQNASGLLKSVSITPEPSIDHDPARAMLQAHPAMDSDQSTEVLLKEGLYICGECNFVSKTQRHLKQHLLTVHSNRKHYQCDKCSYVTRLSHGLKRHIGAMHLNDKPFKCGACSYTSVTKKALQLHHMAKHSGKKPYKCTECEYASVYPNHLKRHVSVMHPDPCLEQCEYCNFEGDSQSAAFWNHLVTTHPDKKKYKCTLCHFTSLQSPRLQKHFMAKHPTEKPYKCGQCDFGTAWSHLMKQHVSEHSNKKPSKNDADDFGSSYDLGLKGNLDPAPPRYKCLQCDYETDRSWDLLKHFVRIHKLENS